MRNKTKFSAIVRVAVLEWTVSRMYETNISDKYTELSNRIDDSFYAVEQVREREKGLTLEISDLKKELIRLQAEEETNRKVNKILTGTQVGLCILLLLLKLL